MENPWADAWNETPKPAKGTESSQEADLATPSWSTGVGIQWEEPSNFTSLWNNTAADPTWAPPKSPYDDIPIGRTSSQSDVEPSDSPVSERPSTSDFQTAPTTPASVKQDLPPPASPPLAPRSGEATPPIPTRSDTPDPFGTFETANTEVNVTSWTTSAPSFSSGMLDDSNAWDAAWEPSPNPEPSGEQSHLDEWEMAKLQKQKQDQHVPPEVLASIMQQMKELGRDLWPESKLEEGETRQPSKDFLSNVPSLTPAVEVFVPEGLVLPASTPFTKSFTAKYMNEALRLTKNMPMTLSSPLAIYMASKGSTAWETSVKTRQDIHQDDVLPPGWRMIQKDKQESLPISDAKKKPGGLLSFLGLKGTESSTDPAPQKPSPSTSRPSSIIGNTNSPRSSLDGNSKLGLEPRSSVSQPPIISAVMTPSASNSGSSGPSATLPIGDQQVPQETTAQPSAVSRFFGRFSRSSLAPSMSSSSRSHSLASSSDDTEFFSDTILSPTDGPDDDETLKGLTTFFAANSPPSVPLPQLLPPPPKPFLPPPASASSTFTTSQQPKTDDPFSLFDSPMVEQPLTSTESNSIQPLVPLVPPARQAVSAPNSSLPTVSWYPPAKPASPIPTVAPISRAQAPTTPPRIPPPHQRRNVTVIMSDAARSNPSVLQAPLPPPPLPPPPTSPGSPSRLPSLNLLQPPQTRKPTMLFDDDEFSEFMSPPATTDLSPQPSTLQTIPFNAFKAMSTTAKPSTASTSTSMTSFSSTSSDQSLLHSSSFGSGLDGFTTSSSGKSGLELLDDDFAEFVSSPTSSTMPASLPPRPPSKAPPPGKRISSLVVGQPTQSKTRQSLPPPPTLTKPDHSRATTLVESAAARRGRWPTPPSPSRRTIALPPPPPSAGKNGLDIFGDLTSPPQPLASSSQLLVGVSGGSGVLPPLRAMSPPLNPVKVNGNRSASPSWSTNGSRALTPTPAKASGGGQKIGGLSAQDLSFFEGL